MYVEILNDHPTYISLSLNDTHIPLLQIIQQMLGTRTKQVNSYGRRGSRIVNVSDRRDKESANSSASDVDTIPPPRPLKRENATIISPAKPRIIHRRLHGSNRSPKGSPLTRNRNAQPTATRDATKRIRSKLDSNTPIRQPLTPLRSNGVSSNERPSSGIKGKPKTSAIKLTRPSLKPHVPVIAVDIIVLDEDGNTLKQERRLSHTEIQTNQVRNVTGKGKKNRRALPPSPAPIAISDDSDEEVSSQPVVKRPNQRPRPIVISSDESEADEKGVVRKKPALTLAESNSESKSLRVEVVIPVTPSQKSKASRKPPSSPPLTRIPSRTSTLPHPLFRPDPVAIPSHLTPAIPLAKPRQLTPIRGSSSRSIFRRPPPTPSTPTETDLSFDLAQLDLSDATELDDLVSAQPEYLIPLLNECAQSSPYEFSAFIETFPFDPIVQSSGEDEDTRFRKIGEASYSEVFGIGDVVLKIIPIRSEEESTHPETDEIPALSDAKDILKEIIVTREVGEICDNFVNLLKTYVVRGRYPSLLLDLWDEYNEKKGSESIRPGEHRSFTDPYVILKHLNVDSFGLMQVYAIIILPNGGPDLESFAFKNISKFGWHQACGIFWQVARALEQAERLLNFEVRIWIELEITSSWA